MVARFVLRKFFPQHFHICGQAALLLAGKAVRQKRLCARQVLARCAHAETRQHQICAAAFSHRIARVGVPSAVKPLFCDVLARGQPTEARNPAELHERFFGCFRRRTIAAPVLAPVENIYEFLRFKPACTGFAIYKSSDTKGGRQPEKIFRRVPRIDRHPAGRHIFPRGFQIFQRHAGAVNQIRRHDQRIDPHRERQHIKRPVLRE